MSNLATVLVEAAERSPREPAVEAGDGTALTYAQLDESSTRVTGGLLAHGGTPRRLSGLTLTHGELRADAALTERTLGTAGRIVAG